MEHMKVNPDDPKYHVPDPADVGKRCSPMKVAYNVWRDLSPDLKQRCGT